MDQTRTPATLIVSCPCLNIRVHLHRKHQQDVSDDESWENLRTSANGEVERGWRVELGMGGITAEQRGLLAVHEPADGWNLLECLNCQFPVCSFRRNPINNTEPADSTTGMLPSWEAAFSPVDGIVFAKDGVLRGREIEKVKSSETYSRAFHLVVPEKTGGEKIAISEENLINLRPEFLRLLRSLVTATSAYVTSERQEMEDRIVKYKASQVALLETRRQQAIQQQENLWSEVIRNHEGEVFDENGPSNGIASVDEELLRLQKHIESPYGQSLGGKSSGSGRQSMHHVGDAPSLSMDQTIADFQRTGFSLRRRPSLNLESDVAASIKMQQNIDAERLASAESAYGIKTGPESQRSMTERRLSASSFKPPQNIADVSIEEESKGEGSHQRRRSSERIPRQLEFAQSGPAAFQNKKEEGDDNIFEFDEATLDEGHNGRDDAADVEARSRRNSGRLDSARRFSVGSSDSETEEDDNSTQGADGDESNHGDTHSGYGRSVPIAIIPRSTFSTAALACEALQTGDMDKMERVSQSLHMSMLAQNSERSQTIPPLSRTMMSRSMAVTSRSRKELGSSYIRRATVGEMERLDSRSLSKKYLGGTDDDLDESSKPFIAPHILAEQEEQESLFIGSIPHRSRKFSSAI